MKKNLYKASIKKRTTYMLCLMLLVLSLGGCKKETKQEEANTTQQQVTEDANTTKNDENEKSVVYQVTGEANPEIMMDSRPISSYWFPSDLLAWNAEEDKDLAFNVSRVPLAKRVDREKLQPVNETQNKDTNVVAISIMNASTSGNPSHGINRLGANTLSYWQYIDKLVYWGGSSGEGLIVPPSPDVTDVAHENGVPVFGTVFFPMAEHGGKIEWLNDFLAKNEDGTFPMIDKLIEVATTYGFDGWFINQETQGAKEGELTKEHADLMKEFIKQFKEKAGDNIEIMWYDSMTEAGKMDWQNALTKKNKGFIIDKDKNKVADSMFLNFWWNTNHFKEDKLLESTNQYAQELGVNPYDLYAGIDVQANGTSTPVMWDELFEKDAKSTWTSLGLYCPSWTYFASRDLQEYERNDGSFWVNPEKDPSVATKATGYKWRGISTYVVERSAITSLPFITDFNMGNGYNYFVKGEQVSEMDWNNRSLADTLPTYRWILEQEGNNDLKPMLDFATAYNGGNCIKFRGKMEAGKATTMKLYSADLKLEDGVDFSIAAKANNDTKVKAILEFEDGSKEIIDGNQAVKNEWTTVSFDVSKYSGKSIRTISLQISEEETVSGYEFRLGNLSIVKTDAVQKVEPATGLKVEEVKFDDESMYAGVRLTWAENATADHYEVYRKNEDGSIMFLGACNNPGFFANAVERIDKTLKNEFVVASVGTTGERVFSTESASMEWPDNSLPKAGLTASKTFVAPKEKVTFASACSQNTTEYNWTFEGANIESSTEEAPVVTYEKEGTYSVSLVAKNEKGEDTITMDGLITVSKKAEKELTNLSLNKETSATAYVNDNEAPQFSVDGTLEKKWCATGNPPHELTIDLGEVKTVSEVYIAHAEAGKENINMNTQKYTISVSADGKEYTEVINIKKNKKGETVDTFKAVEARYVKLSIIKPTQGSDTAARIYEVEVRGYDGLLK